MDKISILGCGTWGSALAQSLAIKNNYQITVWHYKSSFIDKVRRTRAHPNLNDFYFHPKIVFESNIKICIQHSNCIVFSVPSHAIREIAEMTKSYSNNQMVIVNTAKGIEHATLLTMSEVIVNQTSIDSNRIVSLYGPSHAEEVIKSYPTTLVSASVNHESSVYVQKLFSSNVLRVYTNKDIKGVEIGGSLKNVIAIATGIAEGIGFGDNTKAALLTRGLAEITQLGIKMGAKASTFSGLSGIGDLYVTCSSRHSRNRFVGEEIGKGKKLNEILSGMDMVAEGVKTAAAVHKLCKKYNIEMPISMAVYEILYKEKDPLKAVLELMNRDLVSE